MYCNSCLNKIYIYAGYYIYVGMCGVDGGVVEIADELSNAMSQCSIPVPVPTRLAAGVTPSSNVSVELTFTPYAPTHPQHYCCGQYRDAVNHMVI
jgi:hypothetical protein